ncbi:hypothetical protein ZHAS_00018728 [Anopheles sinensis]|uniref:Uncharacterized protein n=1 Tax=Anopheles sinensis TaxID=74873 RepID=A0A084WKE5_ANOSI|nr:hypothetical protein ZHAS_00018728 [Anopheles sinensis]
MESPSHHQLMVSALSRSNNLPTASAEIEMNRNRMKRTPREGWMVRTPDLELPQLTHVKYLDSLNDAYDGQRREEAGKGRKRGCSERTKGERSSAETSANAVYLRLDVME